MATRLLVGLDRRLAVDHGCDDLAVVGGRLLPDDDPVAVRDRGVDHRVADHLQQEQRAAADELAGEREDLLDRLLGEDRTAGSDPADDWDIGRLGMRGALGRLVHRTLQRGCHLAREPDINGSGLGGIAPQEALPLQHRQLVRHARGAGEPDGLTDLADGGRVAPALDRFADHLEHLALARCQAGPVSGSVRQIPHVAPGPFIACHNWPPLSGPRAADRPGDLHEP